MATMMAGFQFCFMKSRSSALEGMSALAYPCHNDQSLTLILAQQEVNSLPTSLLVPQRADTPLHET